MEFNGAERIADERAAINEAASEKVSEITLSGEAYSPLDHFNRLWQRGEELLGVTDFLSTGAIEISTRTKSGIPLSLNLTLATLYPPEGSFRTPNRVLTAQWSDGLPIGDQEVMSEVVSEQYPQSTTVAHNLVLLEQSVVAAEVKLSDPVEPTFVSYYDHSQLAIDESLRQSLAQLSQRAEQEA